MVLTKHKFKFVNWGILGLSSLHNQDTLVSKERSITRKPPSIAGRHGFETQVAYSFQTVTRHRICKSRPNQTRLQVEDNYQSRNEEI